MSKKIPILARVINKNNSIKIICKDTIIYLQEGMLPDIDYIKSNFNFQKTQGQKKLTLEFLEYNSWIVNIVLLREFTCHNDLCGDTFLSLYWLNTYNFYAEYSLSHFIDYSSYNSLLLNCYFEDRDIRDMDLTDIINISDIYRGASVYCMSRFSKIINGIFICYLNKDKKLIRYVYANPENMKQYIKDTEDKNGGLIDAEYNNRHKELYSKHIYCSIKTIHNSLTEEYFIHLRDEIDKLTLFCKKYGFTENSLPVKHLQLYEQICSYDRSYGYDGLWDID